MDKKTFKIEKIMKEFKNRKLKSGSKHGPIVKSRAQAIAIALGEQKKINQKSKK